MRSIELTTERLLKKAVHLSASDLHIIPKENKTVIRFRIDDDLQVDKPWSNEISRKMIAHLKFLAGMDIGEKRLPQSGSLQLSISGKNYYLRLSTMPTLVDESLVVRFHPQFIPQAINKLCVFPTAVTKLQKLINHPCGLIVVCGPTGSGKTTMIYSLLQEIYTKRKSHIVTVEDPIESVNEAFTQVEINERAGLSYHKVLKSLLRHNPDIILIGEIRDKDTAQAAVNASLSGQLVLTTMHANDTLSCIERFKEFDIPAIELHQSCIAIVAQRLVKLTCPFCTKDCHPLCKIHRKNRRSSIVEILSGDSLNAKIIDNQDERDFVTLKDEIKKGVALGYFCEKTYYRLVGDV
jgi:competence protein ComGA